MKLRNWLRWKLAWLSWYFDGPWIMGHPMYGTGDQRRKNLYMLWERYIAREPRRKDYQ